MDTLQVHRARQGLTPGQLAAKAGVSYSLIHSIEKGLPISMDSAKKVADALGVEIADISNLRISPTKKQE